MTVYEIIVQSLKNLGGTAYYSDIYTEYEQISGKPLTSGQKAGIRKCIEDHSSDSLNYKEKNDTFFSVDGLGSGHWGLR